ncbi:MAG: PAS domain S-box protein [Bacteroidota bacterium]
MLPAAATTSALAAENQRLRDENARLRALLAHDDGASPHAEVKPEVAWSASHQALLSKLPAGIVYVDEQQRLHFNRHVEAIIGYTAEQIPTLEAWFATLYPGQSAAVQAIYRGDRELGFPHPTTVPVHCADGVTRHVRFQGYYDVGAEYWLLTDITDEVAAQTALAQSEGFLRSIYEGTDVATWVMDVDPDGTIHFVANNAAFERLTGFSEAYIAGRTPDELAPRIPREAVEQIKANYQRCLDTRAFTTYEECVPIDGEDHWWVTSLTPLFEDGRIWRIIGSTTNIDAQKQVELQLREAQVFSERIIEASPDLTYVLDLETMENVFVSSQVKELLGLSDEEVGAPVKPEIHPEDVPKVMAHLAQAADATDDQVRELEYRARHSDGTWRWFVDRSVPFQRTAAGRVKTVLGTVADMTERKAHEQALERMNAELKQFAYVTSHDLSEPLRTIRSFLDLFKRHYGEHVDERSAEYLRFVHESAARMEQLLKDLLAYSRATNGELQPTEVHLDLEVQRIERVLAKSIAESGATITTTNLPVVAGDRSTLSVLLQNLISNAIKFRGAAPPEIAISAVANTAGWIIKVQDNGIGFDPKHAGRIFKVFQRLHTRDTYPGTGIGLAICQRIVERHGGRITATGTPGKGATFTFTLAR